MALKYKELLKKGIETLKFCDEISQTFKDLTKTLNLSNTDFIRTTEERHKISVQNLWNKLEKMVTYISQNILVGILFQMKHFIMMMK